MSACSSLYFSNYIYFDRHILLSNSTYHADTSELCSVGGYNEYAIGGCMQVYTVGI